MDFDDVLIKPRYSTIESRKDVNIYRDLGRQQVLPIIASNMDSIGTSAMGLSLTHYKAMTALHKRFVGTTIHRAFITAGIGDPIPRSHMICIDTANGTIGDSNVIQRKVLTHERCRRKINSRHLDDIARPLFNLSRNRILQRGQHLHSEVGGLLHHQIMPSTQQIPANTNNGLGVALGTFTGSC